MRDAIEQTTFTDADAYVRYAQSAPAGRLAEAQRDLLETTTVLANDPLCDVVSLRLLSRTARALRLSGWRHPLDDFTPVAYVPHAERLPMMPRARGFIDGALAALALDRDPYDAETVCDFHAAVVGGESVRMRQNWLSSPGSDSPAGAFAIPPPPGDVRGLLDQLPRFSAKTLAGPLAALTWLYEVHPFMDGNGRVARVAFAAWCRSAGLTKTPLLLSARAQFEREAALREAIVALRTDRDFTLWSDVAGSIVSASCDEARRMLEATRSL